MLPFSKLRIPHSYQPTFHLPRALFSHSPSPPFPNLSALLQGRTPHSCLLQIHAKIYRLNAHQNSLLATRLIGQYPSPIALKVFHQLRNPGIFPFNAIIRVLAEDGLFFKAFHVFKSLRNLLLSPNDLTFSFLLKACFSSNDVRYVRQIHTQIVKLGFDCDTLVCNALLAVYSKGFKDLTSARKLFAEMPDKRMISSWTSLIAGCAKSGKSEEVLDLFCLMLKQNLNPHDDTMVSVLSACSSLKIAQTEKWVQILSDVINSGDLGDSHDSVNTVLVYMFGKMGKVEESKERFDQIVNGKRSVLPWNAMIGSYVQNGCSLEALRLFRFMLQHPFCRPNHVTMVSVLSACAEIGDRDLGISVHEYMKSKGHKRVLECNTILATALIDMYSKCGSLHKAKEVFDQMVNKDVILFNAMIMGLALNGEGEEALRLFSGMQSFGLHPNAGTFLGVLCACSHSGLLQKGCQTFLDMNSKHSILPKLEHYACYIDLLARAGKIEEALEVVASMPFKPNNFVWGALLGGCLLHSRVDLAKELSKRLVEVDPDNSAGYVMLSNAFATNRQWGDISGLRSIMREMGVKKQPGSSWISINGIVNEFLVGSVTHPELGNIEQVIDILVKEMKTATCHL